MGFDALVSSAVGVVFEAFAETITLTHASIPLQTQGIYSAPHTVVQFGGVQVDVPDPSVEVLTSDLAEIGFTDGDTVTLRGKTLTAVSVRPGDDGTSLLVLRGYL